MEPLLFLWLGSFAYLFLFQAVCGKQNTMRIHAGDNII